MHYSLGTPCLLLNPVHAEESSTMEDNEQQITSSTDLNTVDEVVWEQVDYIMIRSHIKLLCILPLRKKLDKTYKHTQSEQNSLYSIKQTDPKCLPISISEPKFPT